MAYNVSKLWTRFETRWKKKPMNREPLTSLLLADTTSAGMLGTSRVDDARKGITSAAEAAAAAPAAAGTSAGGLLREGSERRRGMENSLKFSCSSFPLFICFLQNNFISLAQSLLVTASKCSLPVSISMCLSLSIGRSLPLPFFLSRLPFLVEIFRALFNFQWGRLY